MDGYEVRTVRDARRGPIEVSVMLEPFSGWFGRDVRFEATWKAGAAVLRFGISDEAEQSRWEGWEKDERDFALKRLGMSYLTEKVLPTATGGEEARLVLTLGPESESYFGAVQREAFEVSVDVSDPESEGRPVVRIEFRDYYPQDMVDERVKDDLLFALLDSGAYGGKEQLWFDFPYALLSNFWTADELIRNLRSLTENEITWMDDEGTFMSVSEEPHSSLEDQFFDRVSLTREGEKLARQLTPWVRPLFETEKELERDRAQMRAQLAGDELAHAEQLLTMASAIPEVLVRAAGTIAGVVLETHLRRTVQEVNRTVEEKAQFTFRKDSGISVYAGWLKGKGVVLRSEIEDIDHCAYVRNCCTHPPGENLKAPEVEEVKWLIRNVRLLSERVRPGRERNET